MKSDGTLAIFLCNGASLPDNLAEATWNVLDYRTSGGDKPNVRIGLPDFVRSVYYLPPRCLDLMEIAAYVFAGDRLISRGSRVAAGYQSWARNLHYVLRVRDYDFWSQSAVQDALRSALEFVTGDRTYEFTFQPGHTTPPTSLFDREHFQVETTTGLSIILFSGGIDSLVGALQRLRESDDSICLVSHQSQGSTTRTQRGLVAALKQKYPGRVSHYQFRTNLQGLRRREESQRTRSFLYGSIAFAISMAFGRDGFFVYENGVTSLNFARRDDLFRVESQEVV